MRYSDHILILKIRSGKRREENEALRQIREDSFDMIAKWICLNNGTRSDAKDIFQEVCINLVEKIRNNKYQHKAKLTTYNFTVAKNLWYKKLRSRKPGIDLDPFDHSIKSQIDIEYELMLSDCNTTLYKYIKQLSQREQDVIRLYYFEGKRMAEIADIVGFKSEQVAKNEKCKAMKKLTKWMNGLKDTLYISATHQNIAYEQL